MPITEAFLAVYCIVYKKKNRPTKKTAISQTAITAQQILQVEISRAFLPPVLHGEKCGKFQFVVEIAHKAVILILIFL